MRLIHHFLKRRYPKNYSFGVSKSLIFRLRNVTMPEQSLKNRISRFLQTFLIPVFIILKSKKITATAIIIDNYTPQNHYHSRRNYVQHFKPELKDETIPIINGQSFFYKKWTFSTIFQVISIWWQFSILAFLAIFKTKENYSNLYFHKIANNLINNILVQPQSVYYFHSYSPTSYLSAFLIQNTTNVHFIVSNSVMYPSNRYTHLQASALILCSKYQIEETKNYQQLSWIQVKTATYWGPEEIEEFKAIKPQSATFDIGIYSRADWARLYDNRMMRAKDLKKIANYEYADNIHARNFEAILKTALNVTPQPKIKIYLHPFERDLYNNHQIKPAYWQLVKDFGIELDTSEGNSISKIYECTIGIGTFSTIIMDRWDADLQAFALFDEKEEGRICQPRFLGDYGKYLFSDMKALKQLIGEAI